MKIKLPRNSSCPIDAQFSSELLPLELNNDEGSCSSTELCKLLTVLYADGGVVEFDLAAERFTEWTKACLNADESINSLASVWTEPPIGLCLDPSDSSRMFLYGAAQLTLLRKIPILNKTTDSHQVPFTTNTTNSFSWLCKLSRLADGQLVAINLNEVKFKKRLPAPLTIKKFGKG